MVSGSSGVSSHLSLVTRAVYGGGMPANDPTGRRFGEAALDYERGRPEYPAAAVDDVVIRRETVASPQLDAKVRLFVYLGGGS